MLKKLTYLLITLLFISCNSLKTTQQHLAKGNYDTAINKSLKYLTKKKYGKKAPEYKQILWQSFHKAADKDHRDIKFLRAEKNPANLDKIYRIFINLEERQKKLRPILPIKGYQFKLINYNNKIVQTKNLLSDYLYVEANVKFNSNNKLLIREAHEDFKYLDQIKPNYKDTRLLIDLSYSKGIDYVLVSLKNNANMTIPNGLHKDLLNMHEYKLNNYWTVYHGTKIQDLKYDYNLILSFNSIHLSPEHIKEVHFIETKEIVDGKEYVLDKNGNVKKDEKGNDIKKDRIVEIQSSFHQFTQYKECIITAQSKVINNHTKQVVSTTPYQSTFIFEHQYATQTGDRRALKNNYLDLLEFRRIIFPSNSVMILDAGDDIKAQLEEQLSKLRF